MSDSETAKTELRELMTCPLQLAGLLPSLRDTLLDLWLGFARDRQVDQEAEFLDPLILDLETDVEELKAAIVNWRMWGPSAQRCFAAAYGFAATRVADRGEYPKHYPVPGMTCDQIRDLTLRTDSVLYPGISRDDLQAVLEEGMALFPEHFRAERNLKIYLNAGCVVGASAGRDTSVLCYDITSCVAHAYPVQYDSRNKSRASFPLGCSTTVIGRASVRVARVEHVP